MNAIISWLISFNQSSFLHNYSLIGKVRTWPLTVTRLSENQWQLVEMQRSFSLPNYQHARVSATLASAREPRQRNPMMMMIMMIIIIFYQFHSPVNQTGFSNWWWRSKLPELFPNAIHKEFLPLPPLPPISFSADLLILGIWANQPASPAFENGIFHRVETTGSNHLTGPCLPKPVRANGSRSKTNINVKRKWTVETRTLEEREREREIRTKWMGGKSNWKKEKDKK